MCSSSRQEWLHAPTTTAVRDPPRSGENAGERFSMYLRVARCLVGYNTEVTSRLDGRLTAGAWLPLLVAGRPSEGPRPIVTSVPKPTAWGPPRMTLFSKRSGPLSAVGAAFPLPLLSLLFFSRPSGNPAVLALFLRRFPSSMEPAGLVGRRPAPLVSASLCALTPVWGRHGLLFGGAANERGSSLNARIAPPLILAVAMGTPRHHFAVIRLCLVRGRFWPSG